MNLLLSNMSIQQPSTKSNLQLVSPGSRMGNTAVHPFFLTGCFKSASIVRFDPQEHDHAGKQELKSRGMKNPIMTIDEMEHFTREEDLITHRILHFFGMLYLKSVWDQLPV